MQSLATIMLCIAAWGWSIRAGVRIAQAERMPLGKRIAVGNALVALIPFGAIVAVNWPRS